MKPIYLITFILIWGCIENSPGFLEPQPPGAKNLKSFPGKLCGHYTNKEDSIAIYKKMIIQYGAIAINMSKEEIDTNDNLLFRNDTLFDLEEKEQIPAKLRNDSVFATYRWEDTAFHISQEHLLRKSKDFYFLNLSKHDSIWKVVRLKHVKHTNMLQFSTIDLKNEVDVLQKITNIYHIETRNDTIINYALNPSNEEFNAMINSDSVFTNRKVFFKQISK